MIYICNRCKCNFMLFWYIFSSINNEYALGKTCWALQESQGNRVVRESQRGRGGEGVQTQRQKQKNLRAIGSQGDSRRKRGNKRKQKLFPLWRKISRLWVNQLTSMRHLHLQQPTFLQSHPHSLKWL